MVQNIPKKLAKTNPKLSGQSMSLLINGNKFIGIALNWGGENRRVYR